MIGNFEQLKNKKLFKTSKFSFNKKFNKRIEIDYSKLNFKNIEIINLKHEFQGASPPSVFIGSKLTYPNVNVGVMSVPGIEENAWLYDSPDYWSEQNISSDQIIKLRQSLINSRFKTNVFEIRKSNRLLETVREIGMASVISDIEVKLNKKPKPRINFDSFLLPIGPSAELRSIKLVSNTKIPYFIDKVYADTDLKSIDAIKYLYGKGLDEHYLSQLLSIGITGLKKNRKLVTTRNSITAIDDSIGRYLLSKIRDYKEINDYILYYGGHLGNYYLILFFPGLFSYELFEMVFPKNILNNNVEIMTDYEDYNGRKNYANETIGGYYAARFPILQYLDNIKRQASILLLRFVLPEYRIPLGVWVCRNSVKRALGSEPIYFETREEMLKYANDIIINNLEFNVSDIFDMSKILQNIKTQTKLNRWF